jgi:hypothetical protein
MQRAILPHFNIVIMLVLWIQRFFLAIDAQKNTDKDYKATHQYAKNLVDIGPLFNN